MFLWHLYSSLFLLKSTAKIQQIYDMAKKNTFCKKFFFANDNIYTPLHRKRFTSPNLGEEIH